MSVVHVPLTRGKFAVIDEEDLPIVAAYKWCASGNVKGWIWYAVTSRNGRLFSMHRILLGEPVGLLVDHVDGDGLNNRRSNIRIATKQQNMRNRVGVSANNVLGVRGVRRIGDKYQAHIGIGRGNRFVHIGMFPTLDEAIAARREAERRYFGEFAPS